MAKRLFDCVVSLAALLVAAPLMLLIAALIRIDSPGPLVYRGRRVGRHGQPFSIFKFRTMVANADRIGGPSTSSRDPRITRAGGWLRKYKLDELPQLFNVLRGEMSLVGPRPEVQKYVDLYTAEERAILTVRPGVTDWASIWNADEGAVLARYADPDRAYEEVIRPTKLRLQLKYVRERSFLADLSIIAGTLRKLVDRDYLPAAVRTVADGGPGESLEPRAGRYQIVTELPGQGATAEQLDMLHTRYQLAAQLAAGKDVLELACGAGIALDYLGHRARRVVAGDYDASMIEAAARQVGARFELYRLDAEQLPFPEGAFDVILLLEAIYYLPQPERFVAEARRVLRRDGCVLICSANCERPDFQPSPLAHRYLTALELRNLLNHAGFDVQVFAGFPVAAGPAHARVLQVLRRIAIRFHLIPRTMAWKVRLKRLLFGRLESIPARLEPQENRCHSLVPVAPRQPVRDYKVIYAIGKRAA